MAISPRLAMSTLASGRLMRALRLTRRQACPRARSRAVSHHGQGRVVEDPVAGEYGIAVDAPPPFEIGEPSTRLFHDHLECRHVPRLDGGRQRDLALPLGHPQVRGKVAATAPEL